MALRLDRGGFTHIINRLRSLFSVDIASRNPNRGKRFETVAEQNLV
jgi:hypothetical protein